MKNNKFTFVVVAILIVAAVGLMQLGRCNTESKYKISATIVDPSNLSGLQTGNAPWAPELAHLKDRLAAIGLPALPAEGTTLHIHDHLDIFINGEAIAVPPEIGVNSAARFISPLHTHEGDQIIHVESPIKSDFTLGQFFDVWGVKFTKDSIGGYRADKIHELKVYLNGALFAGDPRMLKLGSLDEIAVVYGVSPKTIPSGFSFAPGL